MDGMMLAAYRQERQIAVAMEEINEISMRPLLGALLSNHTHSKMVVSF